MVAAIGQRSRRPGLWYMPIGGGFVARGRRLMRQRGERIERSFAHLYDTGGMRRTHLRGHTNILKRLLIHAGGFNLGLVMRHLIGSGTPRGLQDRPTTVITPLLLLLGATRRWLVAISAWHPLTVDVRWLPSPITTTANPSAATTYTTGCYPGGKKAVV